MGPAKESIPEEEFIVTNVSIAIYGWLRGLLASAQEERGQDLVEYAVLVGFIGVAAAVAFIAFMPDALDTFLEKIGGCLAFDTTTCNLD